MQDKTIILNNIETVNHTLEMNMSKDKSIILYGEDVGHEGGVFRTTQGLQKLFGDKRAFDAPIAEASIVGSAIGASLVGLKPIVELQFQGFSYPSFQQIMTHAARMRNRSRGRYSCPLVIRMPMGGGIRALEHHSEAIEALYAHIPGLKVVMPSNPYDIKGLLTAAINDPDPVIFLEPKKMYRSFKQEIPKELYEIEIGLANVMFEGDDITVVTYGSQVFDCLKSLDILKQKNKNYSVELIDLRSIKPIDINTIIASVKKTGRLLVVHEAVKSFSVSAEIITLANEKAFYSLKTPPARLTGWDITVPYAQGEKYHIITPDRIANKIIEIMEMEE